MTRQFTAAANKREGYTHVLLITTGSVASVKAPLIVDELLKVSNKTNDPLRALILCLLTPHMCPSREPPLVQGRIGAGSREQAVAHVLPA